MDTDKKATPASPSVTISPAVQLARGPTAAVGTLNQTVLDLVVNRNEKVLRDLEVNMNSREKLLNPNGLTIVRDNGIIFATWISTLEIALEKLVASAGTGPELASKVIEDATRFGDDLADAAKKAQGSLRDCNSFPEYSNLRTNFGFTLRGIALKMEDDATSLMRES